MADLIVSPSRSLDLEQLFHEHHHDLLAMLRRMVGCPATAADLAQEAYVRLVDASPANDIVSPRAFLFRTAKNLALDHFRKQKFRGDRQTSIDEIEDIPVDAPSAETQVYDKQRVAALETALGGLSPRTRSVFIMRRVYGYSYQEIAVRMGISERAVEKRLVRAMTHCLSACRFDDAEPSSGGIGQRDTSL